MPCRLCVCGGAVACLFASLIHFGFDFAMQTSLLASCGASRRVLKLWPSDEEKTIIVRYLLRMRANCVCVPVYLLCKYDALGTVSVPPPNGRARVNRVSVPRVRVR